MEQQQTSNSPAGSRRREDSEFNLREWGLKARISRENTNSRRYSASFIRSFREDTRSFRSNITISSTASSPGYSSLRDEIDPSTYSFTKALQALQARSAYNCWECLSPEGFALNSKWNEAEKYICNPLSGEFPIECLSSKTLISGRSFRITNSTTNNNNNNNNRMINMSAPLIFSSRPGPAVQTRPYNFNEESYTRQPKLPHLQEIRMEAMMTRDVGTQSTTPPELSSSSLSPASTPSIIERSLNRSGDSPSSNYAKLIMSQEQVKGKDTREDEDEQEEEKEKANNNNNIEKDEKNKQKQRRGSGGCLSWMMSKRQRHNIREKRKPKPRKTFFLLPILKGS